MTATNFEARSGSGFGPRQPAHRNNWIRGHRLGILAVRNELERAVGVALCDEMVRWNGGQGNPAPDPPDLDVVRAAIRSRSTVVRRSGAEAAGLVLGVTPDAATRLRGLFDGVPAPGREAIMHACPRPGAVTRDQWSDFVRRGLDDRSLRVAHRAAYRASRDGLRELAGHARRSLTRAGSRIPGDQVEMVVLLIERGYATERRGADCAIAVQGPSYVMHVTVPQYIVASLGIEKIVQEICEDSPNASTREQQS